METEFWLLVSVFIAVALLIIATPLWRKKATETSEPNQGNIDIAREKLLELKAELQTGRINQNEYNAQLEELELALNNDLSKTEPHAPYQQGRWMLFFLIITVPVVAILIYQTLGDPNALLDTNPARVSVKSPHNKQIDSVDTMIDRLAERLEKNPNDLQGWLLLGKSYNFLTRFQEAEQVFAKAYALASNNPKVMLQYADAMVSNRDGKFQGKPKQLILKALELSPDDPMGLWLAGMLKAQEQDYQSAMNYWQRAEPMLEQGSESYKKLKIMMANISPEISGGIDGNIQNQPAIIKQDSSLEFTENLNNNGNSKLAWIEKGKAYKSNKQYQKAVAAFAKADLLNSNQAEAMLLYADAMVMHLKGDYTKEAKALIFKALSIDPDNTTGLWLAGKAKVQEGSFYEALGYLRRAKATLDPESNSYAILESYIGKLTAHTNDGQAATSAIPSATVADKPTNSSQNANKANLIISVNLAENLSNSVAPEDTVFIYAKAISGPQMPIAIVRKQVKDLPVQVELTDAQAMTPTMKLSNFQQVNITARISKSGKAIQQPGDLLGGVNSVNVNDKKDIQVRIDQEVN